MLFQPLNTDFPLQQHKIEKGVPQSTWKSACSLVIDFLRIHNLNYSYTVFMRETHTLSSEVLSRFQIASLFNINFDHLEGQSLLSYFHSHPQRKCKEQIVKEEKNNSIQKQRNRDKKQANNIKNQQIDSADYSQTNRKINQRGFATQRRELEQLKDKIIKLEEEVFAARSREQAMQSLNRELQQRLKIVVGQQVSHRCIEHPIVKEKLTAVMELQQQLQQQSKQYDFALRAVSTTELNGNQMRQNHKSNQMSLQNHQIKVYEGMRSRMTQMDARMEALFIKNRELRTVAKVCVQCRESNNNPKQQELKKQLLKREELKIKQRNRELKDLEQKRKKESSLIKVDAIIGVCEEELNENGVKVESESEDDYEEAVERRKEHMKRVLTLQSHMRQAKSQLRLLKDCD